MSKNITARVVLILFFFWGGSHIATSQKIADADAYFIKARDIAFAGNYVAAREALTLLLDAYPNYTDASLMIAKTYSWEHSYDKARPLFNRITSKEKQEVTVWEAAIKNELYADNFNIALGLANKALKHLPNENSLTQLKERVLQEIADQQQVLVRMKTENANEDRRNKLAVSSWAEVYDVVFDPMYYTSIEYHLKTEKAIVIPRINYSQRFGVQGVQYEIDAYPKFSEKYHGYANYGYSNAPTYPRHRAAVELYKELPKAFEASIGARYLQFETDKIAILTGSFGMYRGNYYLSARPFVAPRGQELSVSGSVLARKYLANAEHFFGVQLSYGFDSELSQLVVGDRVLSETLLFVEAQNVRFEYQFTDSTNSSIYNTFIGLTRQELAFDSGNFFYAATLGLQYQFKF